MGFFEGFSKIVFVISYVLWAGGAHGFALDDTYEGSQN